MMETTAQVAMRVGLGLVALMGVFLVPLGLPGTFVIWVAAFLFALATGFREFSWPFLILLGALVAVAELLEFFLGLGAARKFGASRWGLVGVLIGGMIGGVGGTAVAGPLGTIPGAVVGAFGGAFLLELAAARGTRDSLRAGWGAFLGRTLAAVTKTTIALIMAILVIIRVF